MDAPKAEGRLPKRSRKRGRQGKKGKRTSLRVEEEEEDVDMEADENSHAEV